MVGVCMEVTVRLVMPGPRGLMSLPCLDLRLPWTGGTCDLVLSVWPVPIAFIHVARVRRTLLLSPCPKTFWGASVTESLCTDNLEPCLTVGVGEGLLSTSSPGMSSGFVVSGGVPSTVTGPKLYSRGYDRDLFSTSKSARTG